jgi:putative transposase
MKRARLTEGQILAILEGVNAGLSVSDVIRKHGISSTSYYRWKAKYGGLDASELTQIKEQDALLNELEKIVADLAVKLKAKGGS